MTQKVIGAAVVLGLIWAGYMAFLAEKKDVDTQEVTKPVMSEEVAQTSVGVTVAQTSTDKEYFATKAGMALYTFAKDDFNISNCSGECLIKWPAFYSEELLAEDGFGSIMREDGVLQATYLEKPLYTFFKDKNPADTNGDGANGVWFLATFSK